jgi:hypothetical protein
MGVDWSSIVGFPTEKRNETKISSWKKLFEPKVVTKQEEDDDDEPKANVHGNGIGKCLITFEDAELLP